jgi:hypothetical protein
MIVDGDTTLNVPTFQPSNALSSENGLGDRIQAVSIRRSIQSE